MSYFLPPEMVVFNWEDRFGNLLETNWTHPYVPGHHFTDIPVVILTSKCTFSGSEAFPYIMKDYGRATIIGATTRGGAHTYQEVLLSEKYLLLLPHERGLSAKTNQNWEGVGVAPDIITSSEEALAIGIKEILEQIHK